MKMPLIIGLALAGMTSVASADVHTFPHTLEIAGRLIDSPLGDVEIPYQATLADADISIMPSMTPPTTNMYHYETEPAFPVRLDGLRTDFALLLRGGAGHCDADPDAELVWNLTMSYRPVAIVSGTEYSLPGDGLITFIKPHGDPQPLPVLCDDEELRHGAPVVFLIESAITLYAGGDEGASSRLVIDPASRIVIETALPAPSAGLCVILSGLLASASRKRSPLAGADR